MIRHTRQSKHNHDAQKYLSKTPQYGDWEITALFYSAIHIIDEYLISKNKKPYNHRTRGKMVQKEIKPIHDDYHNPYILCRKARHAVDFDQLAESEKEDAIQWHKSICDYVQDRMP